MKLTENLSKENTVLPRKKKERKKEKPKETRMLQHKTDKVTAEVELALLTPVCLSFFSDSRVQFFCFFVWLQAQTRLKPADGFPCQQNVCIGLLKQLPVVSETWFGPGLGLTMTSFCRWISVILFCREGQVPCKLLLSQSHQSSKVLWW